MGEAERGGGGGSNVKEKRKGRKGGGEGERQVSTLYFPLSSLCHLSSLLKLTSLFFIYYFSDLYHNKVPKRY